jgi:hypothetical protein
MLDPLVIDMLHAELDDICLEYEALSYVWGDPQTSKHVSVRPYSNGKHIPITTSLDAALRHLRQRTEPRTIWIDALCIQQSDVQERNNRKFRLYRIASRIVFY